VGNSTLAQAHVMLSGGRTRPPPCKRLCTLRHVTPFQFVQLCTADAPAAQRAEGVAVLRAILSIAETLAIAQSYAAHMREEAEAATPAGDGGGGGGAASAAADTKAAGAAAAAASTSASASSAAGLPRFGWQPIVPVTAASASRLADAE
jgi:hypothetical protein